MMRQKGQDASESELMVIDLPFEFYLKGRDDPVVIPTSWQIRREILNDEGDELMDFMQLCLLSMLEVIDTVGQHRIVLSDRKFNKSVILTDQVQGISLLAPEEETVLRALETGDSSGD